MFPLVIFKYAVNIERDFSLWKKKTIYIENIYCSRIIKNKCENLRKKTYILNPFHFVEPHTINSRKGFSSWLPLSLNLSNTCKNNVVAESEICREKVPGKSCVVEIYDITYVQISLMKWRADVMATLLPSASLLPGTMC